MNQVDNDQPPIMRPLLLRSSNKLCEDCGVLNVSLNRHQYCHECAGNNVDDNEDRMIRDDIIRYHLNTTFRNEEGIRRFSRNEEEDSEIIRNYLRVLCELDNNDIQNFYLQHEMINNKCNPGSAYFYNMVKIFRYRMEYDDEFIPSTPDAEAIEQPTIEPSVMSISSSPPVEIYYQGDNLLCSTCGNIIESDLDEWNMFGNLHYKYCELCGTHLVRDTAQVHNPLILPIFVPPPPIDSNSNYTDPDSIIWSQPPPPKIEYNDFDGW